MAATPNPAEVPCAIVGRVRRAHGIKGEVVVEIMTDAPDAIFASGARVFAGTVDGDLRPNAPQLHVESSRPFKESLLVTFVEIDDRNAADLWRDRYLLVPMDELEARGEDEVFLHELVGLTAELENGEVVGEVIAFYDMPHTLLLEIRRQSGTVLLPYNDQFIQGVDVEAGKLVIAPPDGLLD
ncbi:MAG: ribosome maturation factor RimM [Gemmatimonadaceae bacterium]